MYRRMIAITSQLKFKFTTLSILPESLREKPPVPTKYVIAKGTARDAGGGARRGWVRSGGSVEQKPVCGGRRDSSPLSLGTSS